MSLSARVSFVVVWLVSLLVVGVLASAQSERRDPAPSPVISGADLGFRPEGWRGNKRTGTWVVRINGEWVDAVESMKATPATTRE